MSKDQFLDAYNKIENKNKTYKKRVPKPTHHLMIPFAEDLEIYEENKTEQQSLIDFFNKYIDNTKELVNEKSNKIYFCRDLFREILWCLNDSNDKEYNNQIFLDKDDNLKKKKEKYQRYKLLKQITVYYEKTKKLTTKQLIKLNSTIDKKNKEEVNFLIKELGKELENDFKDHDRLQNLFAILSDQEKMQIQ